MKLLVCISVVPDTTTKITFTDNNTKFNKDGVQFIINPYDELALTKALEIAEPAGGTVTAIHVGDSSSDAVIRKALAIGANDAIRIDGEAMDAMMVAQEISKAAKEGGYDMILTGRESIDYNGGMVGPMLSELLSMPLLNVVTSLEVSNGEAKATRDIDGGREVLTAALPVVVSAQKELCEPRIPNMRGIMQARSKPLNVVPLSNSDAGTSFEAYELPEGKQGVRMIDADNAEELIDILHNEIKVI